MKRLLLLLTVVSAVVASYSQESVFTPIDKNLYPNNMTMVIQLKDGDAVVNAPDVVATANYILNMMPPTFVKESADVDDNGVVNEADLVSIVNIILNEK